MTEAQRIWRLARNGCSRQRIRRDLGVSYARLREVLGPPRKRSHDKAATALLAEGHSPELVKAVFGRVV